MCESCPAHIPGPGEAAGKVARSKVGRKVLVGFCYVMFAGIVVTKLGWWLLPIMLGLAALAAGGLVLVRRLAGRAVLARPEPTPQMRAALAARGLRPIPAPMQARPALPRAMVRSLARRRQALPAPARALPAGTEALEGKVLTVVTPLAKVVVTPQSERNPR